MPRLTLRRARALLLTPLALVVGCAIDSAGPERAMQPEDASFAVVTSAMVFKSKDDPRLLDWLESEKARIDLALKTSERAYDSLKTIWDERDDDEQPGSKILVCDPLQYAATVKIVGPEGEDIDFGPHKLRIQKGALTGYTVVTAEAPVGLKVEARFSPHGLNFRKPSRLSLSYKHCQRPTGFGKEIVYVDAHGRILEWIRSIDHEELEIVDGPIRHFSSYLVAY